MKVSVSSGRFAVIWDVRTDLFGEAFVCTGVGGWGSTGADDDC